MVTVSTGEIEEAHCGNRQYRSRQLTGSAKALSHRTVAVALLS